MTLMPLNLKNPCIPAEAGTQAPCGLRQVRCQCSEYSSQGLGILGPSFRWDERGLL